MSLKFKHLLILATAVTVLSDVSIAAERPTFANTGDPRPDILVHPIYDAHVAYRKRYNRPRYWGGLVSATIAPSSLGAMVWKENVRAGNYEEHHMPPMYKRYFAPKPWELVQTGARPGTPNPGTALPIPSEPEIAPVPVPMPLESPLGR